MGLSRKSKRNITAFSKLQWGEKNARYHLSQKHMIDLNAVPPIDPTLLAAATDAMGILVKNGEEYNANLQAVSDKEIHAEPENPEVGSEQDILDEQDNSQGC